MTRKSSVKQLRPRRAPAPLTHLPELHGKMVRAECQEVRRWFNHSFGRHEVHLFFRLLSTEHAGAVVWGKLNWPEEITRGSYFYQWYCALVGTPNAGAEMEPEAFAGVEADIWLRGVEAARQPYTVVDAGCVPVLR